MFILMVAAIFTPVEAASPKMQQKSFASVDEAVNALVTAIKNNDLKQLLVIFGPAGEDLITSGDPVADRQVLEQFLAKYEEKNGLLPQKNNVILLLGNNDWPFPIPLVKQGGRWAFDTGKGKEEILNRRIGENELNTINVCLAYVDAQREYARLDMDGDAIPEYAEKLMSDPGKKNGLYWETKEGETLSPFGPVLAEARKEGYTGKKADNKAVPYHGYYYRALRAQGKHAPGGAYEYVVKGKLIGGFALVAYPAKYGNSGIMTFIVNHDGVVYEKNFGMNTAKYAEDMMLFDPDQTWKKVDKPNK